MVKNLLVFFLFIQSFTTYAQKKEIIMGAVGDIIFHGALHKQAERMAKNGKPDFRPLWQHLTKHIESVDLMYGNLEGPSHPDRAFSDDKAGTSLNFNFNPVAIEQLAESGFDLFSLANNHSFDQGVEGLTETELLLKSLNIAYAGSKEQHQPLESFATIYSTQGISLAFISCTHHLNGNAEKRERVLMCYESDKKTNPQLIRLVDSLNKNPDIDGIIVTPHWGDEYEETNAHQKRLAKELIDNGVSLILGHHPHVLQKYEVYKGKYIFYSLGNFISNQFPQNRTYQKGSVTRRHHKKLPTRSSVFLYLKLEKEEGRKVFVSDFKVIPLYMKVGAPGYGQEGDDRYLGQGVSKIRTLVPIYLDKFTGYTLEELSELRFSDDLSQIEDSSLQNTVRYGSYQLHHNMKLSRDIISLYFSEDKFFESSFLEEPRYVLQ